ncbi:threonine aldolase family protein [Steroidobacter cummioxidans]|uniref:threonine aldolase family protein n=1 Tax=Steroidobacter cummioxidans TaxID=1803913 RepID=UPI0019D4C9D2|nr:GntG family PLP-dependent aldolase [Steroidobacter cummioxidans]
MSAQMIDVRSDTVTRPTPAMLEAMLRADVGDDVYGEDETVNALQSAAAKLFGHEAALFCPTGTMTNQIGLKVHLRPGDEVICHALAHVYLYEGGGIAANCGASVRLLHGQNGRFTAADVRANINNRDDAHLPWTRVVSIENTVNKGGGSCWDLQEIERIRAVCDEHDLALHLDGARLFNALVARNESPRDYGRLFDTISICLSKGLGAPAGSLLIGSKKLIAQAHRYRKLMGGGMRQSGYIAAAGLYALENNVSRLQQDHARAKRLEAELRTLPYVESVLPVETNIVIFNLSASLQPDVFLQRLGHQQVRALSMGQQLIRFVFHLNIDDTHTDALIAALRSI